MANPAPAPTQAALEMARELWPPDNATEIALAIDAFAVEAVRQEQELLEDFAKQRIVAIEIEQRLSTGSPTWQARLSARWCEADDFLRAIAARRGK